MKGEKVEIIKISDILGLSNGKTFLIATDSGNIVDYYNNILIDYIGDKYKIQKTGGGIISQPETINNIIRGKISKGEYIKGIVDNDPKIGESFTINGRSWGTSIVSEIIDNNIIITKNSVYAINNDSIFRDKQIKKLGI